MFSKKKILKLGLGLGLLLGGQSWAASSALDKKVEQLQREIDALKGQIKENTEMLNETASAMEKGGGSYSKSLWDKLSIGGYGELHYNNLDGEGGASDKKEMDFHRFVLFFGYKYSDTIRFVSEFELEHAIAGESKNGEVELEQAYIDFNYSGAHHVKTGVFLMPVGIINETHEPPTFFGVERNPVEKNIIPATWWEGGVALNGDFPNSFSYDFALSSGLNTTSGKNYKIRDGRQKISNAEANDLAVTGRIKWNGVRGLELALTYQNQGDVTQGNDSTAGGADLIETHLIWMYRGFTLKALYASWDLDGTGPQAVGADEQKGFYIEPSYHINEQFGIFARFNQYDNQAGDNTGSEKELLSIGFNYWPHEDVVLKFDIENQDNEGGQNQDGFNIGVGYQF